MLKLHVIHYLLNKKKQKMKTPTPNPQTAKKPWYTIIPGLLFLVLCSGITGYMISEHNLGKQLKGNSNPDLCETFSYSSGEGEEYAPYLIENIQGLQAMKCDLSSYYKLNNNIDASSTSTWNYDEELDLNLGFEPVGDSQEIEDSPFTGSLDGNGYIISGLYINRPQTSGVGLFGHTNYGNGINDIALEGGSIIGHENVGALVGNVYGTEIQDSYSTTNVTGQNSIGGLVGYSEDNSIYRSYSSGTVTGQGSDGPNCSEIGDEPTCAETDGCYFEDGECWEQESEETGRNIGGLVGNASEDVSIYRSFATGNVSGTENVGGLVGYMDDESSTSNTYATGSVTGTNDYIGGLIGYLGDDSDIDYSYATGSNSRNDLKADK